MSGGFFRGTSADQDTRFSNKQAKLLKSQKFAPELENLVDITRVKMDVMRPWIAKRVTELIGFEDEVLINFIYSLLEGKAVNGKQIQISLTGFMERNTGKFMKELWVLLLSAQQNVSGVPQQFLDAKEEETKKRMAETDRIANEIQRKKENEYQEAEKEQTKMDGDADIPGIKPEDEKDDFRRKSERTRSRVLHTPDSSNHSPSPRRKHSTSPSKSYSSKRKSRSRSRGRPSRSPSVSFQGKGRSSPKRSVSPYRKHAYRRSPSPRHMSSYSRRRLNSTFHAQYKGHSPRRNISRTPVRYRSRSPSPRRSRRSTWRSPIRYRSRTPVRRMSRSPIRQRPPSPMLRRSPSPRGRSPAYRRRKLQSPEDGSSLSPVPNVSSHRRYSSPGRRRYHDSPVSPRGSGSPAPQGGSYHKRKSSTPIRGRTSSPHDSKSPVPIVSSSPSRVRRESPKSATASDREKARIQERRSPKFSNSPNTRADPLAENHRGRRSVAVRPAVAMRSPQRDTQEQDEILRKGQGLPPQKSLALSDVSGGGSSSEERLRSPGNKKRDELTRPGSLNTPRQSSANRSDHVISRARIRAETNVSSRDAVEHKFISPEKLSGRRIREDVTDGAEIAESDDETNPRKKQLSRSEASHDMEDHRGEHHKRSFASSSIIQGKQSGNIVSSTNAKDKKDSDSEVEPEANETLPRKSSHKEKNGSVRSASEESDERRDEDKEKKKRRKSDKYADESSDDQSSYDSYEERKEAKKRRRERKKLKREDRRRRREERHLARDERRAEKLKSKSGISQDEAVRQHDSKLTDVLEMETDPRKLEIELREKAIESIRAKRGLGN